MKIAWHLVKQAALLGLMACLTNPPLSRAQAMKVGEPAPDFAVASLDGRSTIRLSDFRGRRVLIFTWATW
jgi:peroxiredoxin